MSAPHLAAQTTNARSGSSYCTSSPGMRTRAPPMVSRHSTKENNSSVESQNTPAAVATRVNTRRGCIKASEKTCALCRSDPFPIQKSLEPRY